jgi:hypothetical protein
MPDVPQPPHFTPARRKKRWNGPVQYEDKSGQLMMLPTGEGAAAAGG